MENNAPIAVSNMSRIILISLLPVIAIIIYFEGQSYDPALIQFKSGETGQEIEASFFPDEFETLNRAGQPRTYNRENLYEYINGHAEFFIKSGFLKLTVTDYIQKGSTPNQPDAVVDIYDMGKAIHAFGILSDEAGENPLDLQIGSMGFKTSQGINFIKGKYYIKVTAYSDNLPLDSFARGIDDKIKQDPDTFPVFSRFPDIGEVLSTRYIKEAYRGLEFVNNVVEREYKINNNIIRIFIVMDEESVIDKLTVSFVDYFHQSEINYTKIDSTGKTLYIVNDPYEGDWYMLPMGNSLLGIFGEANDSVVNAVAAMEEQSGK
ncbi:MAG: DUF6599 family protein [Nitrospirota bacterium]